MRAIAVDDEPRALHLIQMMLEEIEGVELAGAFQDVTDAIEFLKAYGADVLFLDVSMPGRDGISMAQELKGMSAPPKVVFVTGHKEFALKAWEVDAVDFVLKPYRSEDIRHAIARCKSFSRTGLGHKVEAKCFPGFDLFVDGQPMKFHNKKAKELLAFLVHGKGEWVDMDKIVYNLFGDRDEESGKKYYNVVSYRLRRNLSEAGIEDILEVDYGKCRIRKEHIFCDYYSYLEGREELFTGDYMQEYSWAEPTVAGMIQMMLQKQEKK